MTSNNPYKIEEFSTINTQIIEDIQNRLGESELTFADPMRIIADVLSAYKQGTEYRLAFIVQQVFEATATGKYLDRLLTPYTLRKVSVPAKGVATFTGQDLSLIHI